MMQDVDPEIPKVGPPRTSTVLVFLLAGSVIFSYMGVYAATNAMIAADMMSPWPPGADPRPRWMIQAFVALFVIFALGGLFFRWLSNRQLKAIDDLANAEVEKRLSTSNRVL